MSTRTRQREIFERLLRWAAGAVVGLAGVAVFLTLFFIGDQWPRKRAARRIRGVERMVVALLPAATPEREKAQLLEAFDCTVKKVWTDTLPREDALPLVCMCYDAIKDGVLSPEELTAIQAQASALCSRGHETRGH